MVSLCSLEAGPRDSGGQAIGGTIVERKADSIASFELFKVPPRWLFLRVETKAGVVGWGEPNLEGFSGMNEGKFMLHNARTLAHPFHLTALGLDPRFRLRRAEGG